MTKNEAQVLEKRTLENEILNLQRYQLQLRSDPTNITNSLIFYSPSLARFESLMRDLQNHVLFTERESDFKRRSKLEKLKKLQKPRTEPSKVKLFNLTEKTVPPKVEELLSLGKNLTIGGSNRGSKVYVELNKLFAKWRFKARSMGIDEKSIETVRCNIFLLGQKIEKTYAKDPRVKDFLNFCKQNPDCIFLLSDKTPDIVLMKKSEYQAKLAEVLETDNFIKVESFNLETELASYRKLVRETVSENFGEIAKRNLDGQNSISNFYGNVKVHKSGYPLRPISAGFSSLTNKAENFLKNFFDPLLEKCTFLLKGMKEFKEVFLPACEKFDYQHREIVSFDAKSVKK